MTLRKKLFESIAGKGENAVNNVYYPYKTNFNYIFTFILSSANTFNLDKAKLWLFGKWLNLNPQTQKKITIPRHTHKKKSQVLMTMKKCLVITLLRTRRN